MKHLSQNLGELIKDLRQQAGVSQKELCKEICSQSEISKIESGKILPTIYILMGISSKLGVEPSYFFNQLTKKQFDIIYNVKNEIRNHVHEKNYKKVKTLVDKYENHSSFQTIEERQFILWHKGIIEYYLHNNLKHSLCFLEESLRTRESLKHNIQDIHILNSLAVIHSETGQYLEAIDLFKLALRYYFGLNSNIDYKIYNKLCYNISKPLISNKNYKEALTYCELGVKNCLETHSNYLLGGLYYQQGYIYSLKQEYQKSLENFTKAHTLFTITNKKLFAAKTLEKIKNQGPI
ncbi:hypothetical protein IEE_05210 [Bacillus cereus BAG5X1-1]|uniref:HTH cro/C1-type domain-containing protein n=1 Tax=Bacillus cereus BAG5X1-1 TaxID=1053189 RepID=J8AFN0_BACCE|nr:MULTISPECIES: helix-turn-helix domain-containing protein [Bacillus cereus group]EJQ37424.1 hypothetical protein IEE_05210 [Bacillus cereus BAG5X1-1]PEU19691.1 transcriptional regulator [Bacillus wiedmannii]